MKTLIDMTEDLYDHYRGLRSSPYTIARIKTALKIFTTYLEDERGVSTPEALTLEHIHAFQVHLGARLTKHGLPMKPRSINSVVKGVRPFLGQLYERGLLRRPLAKHLQYVKVPDLLPTSILTHAQVKQLMDKIDTTTPAGIRDRAAIELLYSSGIRIGELEGLTLQDIDLERGIARVVGKGRKERYVPIGKTALKWLSSYIRGVRSFLVRGRDCEAVFINQAGRPLSQHSMRDRVRDYGRQFELETCAAGGGVHITPHTFRRSCTTEMIKGNANLYHVKQLLGHSSFETLNRYARLDISDLRKTHTKCHPREHDD
jgi:integrase/recombinase XerD